MPKITSIIKLASVSLALAALSACANSSSDPAPGLDANGKHPANWVQQHAAVYKEANGGSAQYTTTTPCSQCHGSLLDGGVAKVSCFTAQWNGISCHPNADLKLGHPTGWANPTSTSFHGAASATFNGLPVQGSTTLAAQCGPCHSVNSTAVGVADAPSCLASDENYAKFGMSCHAASPAAANASKNCVSCHTYKDAGGNLTGPDGGTGGFNNITGHPNRAGAHASHLAFPQVTCATCHSGYGTGTAQHATSPANGIAFLKLAALARAESGAFAYSNEKCSGISCHGGQATPSWRTGGLGDLSLACMKCHSFRGTTNPQFNDYFTGTSGSVNLHQFHLAVNNPLSNAPIFCTDCHHGLSVEDPGVIQHFGSLNGTTVTAISTLGVGTAGANITVYQPSNVPNLYNCTNECHRVVLQSDPTSRAINPAPWPKN